MIPVKNFGLKQKQDGGISVQISFSNTPVYDIQSALRQLAEFYPTIPKLIPDGIYGSQTCLAVQAFQRKSGLNPTGQVDYETWQAIFTAYQNRICLCNPPDALCLFQKHADGYQVEDTGETVSMIQIFLNVISQKYKNFSTHTIDGIYGEKTKAEIQKFQKICALEPTGITDLKTWNRLLRFYELFVQIK